MAKFLTRDYRARFAKKSAKREKEDLRETAKDAETAEITAKDAETAEALEMKEPKLLRL